ncbi:hypothetical protein AB6A40_008947 [Gnathostoma spinigerum]|uniref:GDP-Man:Man(3)GlcNAc(2)-PP-Dol alpha-1,2-mannosyltransferase n=1 Tax=Gnathostoma spinigerum TaxID=75299 RepID=A0ABD6EQL4_9BILA
MDLHWVKLAVKVFFVCLLLWSLSPLGFCALPFLAVIFIMRTRLRKENNVVAFFHPYCNAGGGGERVLWSAINAMHESDTARKYFRRYIVFTGDRDVRPSAFFKKAKERFNIDLDASIVEFIYLKSRPLLEARYYPRFTLAFQTLAGFIVGIEALWFMNPSIFIDTAGHPATLPLFRFVGGSQVGCYVHYPTISCDMLNVVEAREATYNNAFLIANSSFLSNIKLIYYHLFAFLYRLCGQSSQLVMVNGSWTREHIQKLWGNSKRIYLVYPPCAVNMFSEIVPTSEKLLCDKHIVQLLSVGQIRPEKNHKLQIDVLKEIKARLTRAGSIVKVKLVICGGCRNKEDEERVSMLKLYASKLGLTEDDLQWALNVPINELSALLGDSLVGIHSMWNEHFGISVVESLAAGQIMVAHNSGGPAMDIIGNVSEENECHTTVGFLASTVDEYANCVIKVIAMDRRERDEIRKEARKSVVKFNEVNFAKSWNEAVSKCLL